MTKILLSGLFGIFSHTLTQLIVEAQDFDNNTDDGDNNSHTSHNNYTVKRKKKNTQDQNINDQTPNINIHPSPFIMDNDDNNNYVDTNYRH